ncbi:MAG TPA: hypothetical protein VHQ45_11835 [Gemmatimonadaceae bacterium]|nr:hypothetical protein [Gemmatimonadaceae bacterium]
MRAPRWQRALALGTAALGAAAIAAACTELPSSPTAPFSLLFSSPNPSIVLGDSLRDSLGRVAPLQAVAFNADNQPIPDADIRYLSLDTGVTVDTLEGFVKAGNVPLNGIRLFAQAGAVPGVPQLVDLVPQPDTLVLLTPEPIGPVLYNFADATDVRTYAVNSDSLSVEVRSGTTAVRSWLVSYSLFYRDTLVAPRDTTRGVWLVGDGTAPAGTDTTDASGRARRFVRVRPSALAGIAESGQDSVTVVIKASYAGEKLRGGERRLVIRIQPES